MLITAKNGNTFSDSTGLLWDATAAVESEKGFQILLAGDQDKQKSGQVKLMSANKEGVVYKISGWQDQQEFLDENDAFSSVSLPDYFVSEPSEDAIELDALIPNH